MILTIGISISVIAAVSIAIFAVTRKQEQWSMILCENEVILNSVSERNTVNIKCECK